MLRAPADGLFFPPCRLKSSRPCSLTIKYPVSILKCLRIGFTEFFHGTGNPESAGVSYSLSHFLPLTKSRSA